MLGLVGRSSAVRADEDDRGWASVFVSSLACHGTDLRATLARACVVSRSMIYSKLRTDSPRLPGDIVTMWHLSGMGRKSAA